MMNALDEICSKTGKVYAKIYKEGEAFDGDYSKRNVINFVDSVISPKREQICKVHTKTKEATKFMYFYRTLIQKNAAEDDLTPYFARFKTLRE